MTSEATNTPPAETPAAENDWLAGVPDDLRGMAEEKGWKEPADALRTARQMEEFLGADKAGRGLVLPSGDDDKEGYERVYQALGRPDAPDGYELNSLIKDPDADQAFMGGMSQAMHEAGLSKAQAHKLAGAYQAFAEGVMEENARRYQAELAEMEKTFPKETLEQARRAFRLFGLPEDEGKQVSLAIESALGVKAATELFARLGRSLAEDQPVDGAQSLGFSGSPDAALRRLDRLKHDEAFTKRYLAGEKEALAEVAELTRRATAK